MCFEYMFASIRKHTLFYTLTEWGSLIKSSKRDLYCLIVSISFKFIDFILSPMTPNIFNSNFTFHSVSSPYMGINQYSIHNVLNLREWNHPTHPYTFLLRIFSMECHPTVPFSSLYQGNKHTNSVFCCDQFEIQQSIY